LEEAGEEIIRIDGHTNSKERQRLVQHFQTSADVRFAVLAITAAGISITLTAGTFCFYFSICFCALSFIFVYVDMNFLTFSNNLFLYF